MNRKIKWFFTFSISIMFIAVALYLARLASMIFYLNRNLGGGMVPSTLLAYANLLNLQAIFYILLAIIIPIMVWWKEE